MLDNIILCITGVALVSAVVLIIFMIKSMYKDIKAVEVDNNLHVGVYLETFEGVICKEHDNVKDILYRDNYIILVSEGKQYLYNVTELVYITSEKGDNNDY